MEKTNTVDEFFDKLPKEDKEEADIFNDKPVEKPETEVDDDDPEKAHESIKDRRHRRLEQKLQQERETNIELNAILKTKSEQENFIRENSNDVDARILKMFAPTEEGKQFALTLNQILEENKEKAKEQALREIKDERAREISEQKEYESLIDNELESLEDVHGIDLTSDSPKARKTRTEFLTLVSKLSAKDDEGNIVNYADFESTFEMYQKTKEETKVDNTRRQDIASRSMQRSNSGNEIVRERTKGFDGWKKDYAI